MQPMAQHPRLLIGREHNSTRPITKEHAGAAVSPIQNAREDFGTNDQCIADLARLNKQVSSGHGIGKATTNRLYIEGGPAGGANFFLHQTGSGRKNHIGRRGRHDDHLELRSR